MRNSQTQTFPMEADRHKGHHVQVIHQSLTSEKLILRNCFNKASSSLNSSMVVSVDSSHAIFKLCTFCYSAATRLNTYLFALCLLVVTINITCSATPKALLFRYKADSIHPFAFPNFTFTFTSHTSSSDWLTYQRSFFPFLHYRPPTYKCINASIKAPTRTPNRRQSVMMPFLG